MELKQAFHQNLKAMYIMNIIGIPNKTNNWDVEIYRISSSRQNHIIIELETDNIQGLLI